MFDGTTTTGARGLFSESSTGESAAPVAPRETTEPQVAYPLATPYAIREAEQYAEIVRIADLLAGRADHWNDVAARLRDRSEFCVGESKRVQRLADVLIEVAASLRAIPPDIESS